MRSKAEIDAILNDIRGRLAAKRSATGIDLFIPPDGYSQDDDWLSVIVAPNSNGIRAYQYVDTLSEVENDLRAGGLEKVLLVPAAAA